MIFNILVNTTELWMTEYIIGEIFSSGGATLFKKNLWSNCVQWRACNFFRYRIYSLHRVFSSFIIERQHETTCKDVMYTKNVTTSGKKINNKYIATSCTIDTAWSSKVNPESPSCPLFLIFKVHDIYIIFTTTYLQY